MELTQPVQVAELEAVLLYKIRLNRGDSGRVVKDFYYLDPDIAQAAFDAELPENRFGKVTSIHGLYDRVANKYYICHS